MRKTFLLFFAAVLLIGCSRTKTIDISRLSPADHGSLAEDGRVTLCMDHETYSLGDDQIYWILENQSDHTVYLGRPQAEVEQEGQWYSLPLKQDLAFTTEQPFLPADWHRSGRVDLSIYDIDPAVGHYRVVLPYWMEDGQASEPDHYASCEFEIVKQAKRVEYVQFVEQLYDIEPNLSNGIAILGETVRGQEVIDHFLERVLYDVPAEMRLIYPEEDIQQHFYYKNGCCIMQEYKNRAVSTYSYSFLYYDEEIEEVFFSNYTDLNQARAEGFKASEPEEYLQIGPSCEENVEWIRKFMKKNEEDPVLMKHYLYGDGCSIQIGRGEDGFWVGYQNQSRGEVLETYSVDGLHPIGIRPVTRDSGVVFFASGDGQTQERILNAKTGQWEE